MGNRAVITTERKDLGVYLHWNGGRDSVEAFLKYCELKGYASPERDTYGWARLCQVIGNYFGGTNSVGISRYEESDRDNFDNGVYIIENWKIIGREFNRGSEQREYDLNSFNSLVKNLNELVGAFSLDLKYTQTKFYPSLKMLIQNLRMFLKNFSKNYCKFVRICYII